MGLEPARLRTPRPQQETRFEEAVVGVEPQPPGVVLDGDIELAAADAVALHHLAGVDVDGEQAGPFLAEFASPQQINCSHRVARDPAATHPAADHGSAEVEIGAHQSISREICSLSCSFSDRARAVA